MGDTLRIVFYVLAVVALVFFISSAFFDFNIIKSSKNVLEETDKVGTQIRCDEIDADFEQSFGPKEDNVLFYKLELERLCRDSCEGYSKPPRGNCSDITLICSCVRD